MLQYLIVLLDRTSTSYCHYQNVCSERHLISLDDLKAGIFFAMKENLMLQFVYPDYEIPEEYKKVIDTIDHSDIVSNRCSDNELRENAEVIVFDCLEDLKKYSYAENSVIVVRTSKNELFGNYSTLEKVLSFVTRVNIVITDIDKFKDSDFETYKNVLCIISGYVDVLYKKGRFPQINLLTDRILLDKMNNCNAGFENITLAPDGRFYVCPAFYLEDDKADFGLGLAKFSIGSLKDGLDIKNSYLYKLESAPICRKCDAYHCKRCVWINRKMTYEVNTPSYEQCVIAHIERNASRDLLDKIQKNGNLYKEIIISKINYLDPFDIVKD